MDQRRELSEDDQDIIAAGYKPQLKRSMGYFASFAISFSFMSVLMGVYTNYSYVLGKAGPFGLWTWLIVGAGQLLVAFVFAEMAGRIPLTGALYNWNNKLSHPSIAVTVHWLTVFAYTIGGAGIIIALMTPLQTLMGMTFSMPVIYSIGIGIFLLQVLIAVYGIHLGSYINKVAVIAEIIVIILVGLILLGIVFLKGEAHPELLTTIPASPTPYWPVFLVSILLGAWTIFGFETPSDLSEETIQAKQIAPKAIIVSVIASALLGFFFIVAITVAIPNLPAITAAADPISTVVANYLGNFATNVFLVFVLLAMFATSLLAIILASRLLFAVSRDKHFVAHEKFSQVSRHGIPFYATLVVAAIGVIVFLTMYSLAAVFASAVVVLSLAYLITVLNFTFSIKRLPPTQNFSLGSWHWPITILAIAWLIAEICILTIPSEFHLAAIIGFGIFIFAAIQYPLHNLFAKEKKLARG